MKGPISGVCLQSCSHDGSWARLPNDQKGAIPDATLASAILALIAHRSKLRIAKNLTTLNAVANLNATPVITLPRSRIQVVTGI